MAPLSRNSSSPTSHEMRRARRGGGRGEGGRGGGGGRASEQRVGFGTWRGRPQERPAPRGARKSRRGGGQWCTTARRTRESLCCSLMHAPRCRAWRSRALAAPQGTSRARRCGPARCEDRSCTWQQDAIARNDNDMRRNAPLPRPAAARSAPVASPAARRRTLGVRIVARKTAMACTTRSSDGARRARGRAIPRRLARAERTARGPRRARARRRRPETARGTRRVG